METALLLAGVIFFLVCTVLFLRHAFATTIGWGVTGLVFPPAAFLFYVLSWQRLKRLAVAHVGSTFLLVLACLLWVRAHPFAFDDTRLTWLRDAWAPAFAETPMMIEPAQYVSERELQPYLQGSRHPAGYFLGEQVEFVRTTFVNNILRFKSDEDVLSRMEVAIALDKIPLQTGENLLEYTPESLDSPVIHVTYYPEGQQVPEMKVYTRRYWMELLISVKDGMLYTGYVKLRLPDRQRSFLAGEYRAYTRDLRFEGDEVDRQFDSNATIEYVAEQYLINKLGNQLEQVLGFTDTFFQTALDNPTGRTEAKIRLLDGSQHQVKIDMMKGSEGWVVDSGPTADLLEALRRMRAAPAGAIAPMPVRERLNLVNPDRLDAMVGQTVVILTRDGKQREGTISDVDQHNVTLAQPMDGGVLGMLLKRRDITEVKLRH